MVAEALTITEEKKAHDGVHHIEAMKIAFKLAQESGGKFINGHDHPDVMAGAGTIALEILEDVSKRQAANSDFES
ncbi:hypothetical protein COOONC_23132 [Cooperia oncophora]